MAPGLVTPEKARARQAPDRRHVAHDRLPHRAREDRLPDAEARGAGAPLRAGVLGGRATCAWTRSPAPGTLGAVAASLGRRYLLMDESPEARRDARGGERTVMAQERSEPWCRRRLAVTTCASARAGST